MTLIQVAMAWQCPYAWLRAAAVPTQLPARPADTFTQAELAWFRRPIR